MRILLIAPFNPGPKRGSFFYGIQNQLANGLIRNGHFVLTFDERPYVKRALGNRRLGEWLVQGPIIETAKELHPDLICLHKSVLVGADTAQRLRESLPDCRIAAVWHDPILFRTNAFKRLLEAADFGFATTGGPWLEQFATVCPVAFIPNPVDISVQNLTAYATRNKTADVFCAVRKEGRNKRFALIDDLQRIKPNLRYAIYGRSKQDLLFGDAYFRCLDSSRVGLNVNKYEGGLYASDRMAQYLGNGLLVASYRASGYSDYFDTDEMIFFDGAEDLGAQIERAVADDQRWRLMAERGRAKAVDLMGEGRVADFILRMTLGHEPPKDWPFFGHVFPRPARSKTVQANFEPRSVSHDL